MPQPSPLLTAVTLGDLTLRNRVVMAPMTRSRAVAGRLPSPHAVRYYAQRASAGLIVTEAIAVAPKGAGYVATPELVTPAQVDAWRAITDAVHARGGRIVAQLWHTGRIGHPAVYGDGSLPVAPSAIGAEGALLTPEGMQPFPTPRALALDELPGIVASFADGARRAIAAGFDGVELHAANGYLLDQFLRDGSNRRTDAYGGPVANRARLLLEVVDAVTAAIGAGRTAVRLSPFNAYNSMHDADPAATFTHVARALAGRGLAFLHVTQAGDQRSASDAPSVRALTAAMRAAFDGPLVLNGGFDQADAEAALRAGRADAIAFGVPFIANPDLVERFAEGAPLATADRATFYGGDAAGYVDYPARDGRDALAHPPLATPLATPRHAAPVPAGAAA